VCISESCFPCSCLQSSAPCVWLSAVPHIPGTIVAVPVSSRLECPCLFFLILSLSNCH
jgi:hypothetical protein